MKVKIEVTAEDIAKGRIGNDWFCPIALAAKRCTGQECGVFDDGQMCVGNEDYITLPPSARDFVMYFDMGLRRELRPFAFEIEVSDASRNP